MGRLSPALLVVALLVPRDAGAQDGLALDASFGVGADGNRTAVALVRRVGGLGTRVSFAMAARGTAYAGESVTFASRGEGPGSFAGDVVIDPSVYGLNLMGEVAIHLADRVGLGFNLDLLGVALGPERATAAGATAPATLSLFLYGNNDRGSLNSELFVVLRASASTRIRLGLSHYVVGYESAGTASVDATRFQRFYNAGFVAIRLGR